MCSSSKYRLLEKECKQIDKRESKFGACDLLNCLRLFLEDSILLVNISKDIRLCSSWQYLDFYLLLERGSICPSLHPKQLLGLLNF